MPGHSAIDPDRPRAPPQEGAAAGNFFRGIIARQAQRVRDEMDQMDHSLKGETIHDIRVDITTLRDALSALPAGLPQRRVLLLRRQLKWLKIHLAPAREWDVFIDSHKLFHGKRFADDAMQLLAANAHALHLKALRELTTALHSRQSAALRQSLDALCCTTVEQPDIAVPAPRHDRRVRQAASKILDTRWSRVSSSARHLDELRLKDLHQLRIEVRRLRHLCELLQPLFGKQAGDVYVSALTDIQSTLGAIQDGVSAQRLASTLADQSGDQMQSAVNAIQLRHKSHRKHLRKQLRDQWDAFKTLDRFWTPMEQAVPR